MSLGRVQTGGYVNTLKVQRFLGNPDPGHFDPRLIPDISGQNTLLFSVEIITTTTHPPKYIPETDHVSRACNYTVLASIVSVKLFPVLGVLYFYISTF